MSKALGSSLRHWSCSPHWLRFRFWNCSHIPECGTMIKKKNAVVLLTAAFLLIVLIAGCTQIERDGMSPIPQNSPGSWELNPYGDLQN